MIETKIKSLECHIMGLPRKQMTAVMGYAGGGKTRFTVDLVKRCPNYTIVVFDTDCSDQYLQITREEGQSVDNLILFQGEPSNNLETLQNSLLMENEIDLIIMDSINRAFTDNVGHSLDKIKRMVAQSNAAFVGTIGCREMTTAIPNWSDPERYWDKKPMWDLIIPIRKTSNCYQGRVISPHGTDTGFFDMPEVGLEWT